MATILWEKEIDKTIDWGNADGLGTPVSGQYVQKFIKDSLAKKFGYLYFDRSALKYYVFADEDDYNEYSSDPIANEGLLLATFDAPSPADISIVKKSADNVTTLLSATGRKITFNYYIVDKSQNPVAENVSLRAVISRSGEQQTFTEPSIKPDTTVDKSEDPENTTPNYANKNIGTHYELNLDNYLANEGTYTITITLTGLNTQASTTLTFFYTVVDLELSFPETFKYYTPFDYADSELQIPYIAKGAAGIPKTIEIFVDGEHLNQSGLGYGRLAISSGDSIGTNGNIAGSLSLYNKDVDGNLVCWSSDFENEALRNQPKFKPGKHNLQLRISIPGDSVGELFYSKTQYLDFVVFDNTNTAVRETYLLYATEVEAGTIFDANAPIEISGQQYTGVSLSVAAVDNQNRTAPVNYAITGRNTGFSATIEKSIDNASLDEFTYRFDTADTYDLKVSVDESFATSTEDEINAVISIEAFSMENETIEESQEATLLAKYTALNRGNGETNKDVWENTSPNFSHLQMYKFPATFNNVLWNNQSGWDGEALVLKNGATVELPIDLFEQFRDDTGLTFEIDFETFDVQDDDAVILDYRDYQVDNNGNKSVNSDGSVNYSIQNQSYLKITATAAEAKTSDSVVINTNFKDGTRNKIAFAFNPTATVVDGKSSGSTDNPNLIMIYVNGVLDRAQKWGNGQAGSATMKWGEHNLKSIILGNTTGLAGVKIYAIRVYFRALNPEEAFMNYVVDQGSNIPAIIKKNHVYDANKEISLELVKAMMPCYVLSSDYDKLNTRTNKKNNTMYEAQYFDPTDPTLNFYVRNGWMSLQGTSSMQYPTKNLRPYFNKQANGKTFRYNIADTSVDAQALSNQGVTIDPIFATEFWPVSEYQGYEDTVASYVDSEGIVPYSVNKKEVTKDKFFANAYHEIGQGLTKAYRSSLAIKYSRQTDIDGNKVNIYFKNGTRTILSDGKEKSVDKYDIITETETQTIEQRIAEIVEAGGSVYISAYRPLRRTGMELGSDEYWIYIKQLRWSGVGIFTMKKKEDEAGNKGYDFSKAKKLNKDTEYYCLGTYWRQWNEEQHYSGWTDRWTFKADYAESSMSHNGGVGALWGNALRNFKINGQALGMTQAQACSQDPYFIDIRTSCDSKPIVLFVKKPIGYDLETGKVTYGTAEFAGLFIIMTDKSSTPLFGFEDIKDENNSVIFDASSVQCWEHLQNGSLIAQGLSTRVDSENAVYYGSTKMTSDKDLGLNIGEDRPIFTDYEPRWPESGEAKHEGDMRWFQDDVFGTESNALESFINWLNFCRPAINYEVNGGEDLWLSGYDLSPYVAFDTSTEQAMAEIAAWREESADNKVYIQWDNSGNIAYCKEGEKYIPNLSTQEEVEFVFNQNALGLPLYWLNTAINYEKVRKSINNQTIGSQWGGSGDVYKVEIEGFDSLNHCINLEDGSINEDEASKYLVEAYMRKEGARYLYTDSYGKVNQVYSKGSEIDADDYEKAADGTSYATKTFMQYFSDSKYDHLDVYKVAAYYIYIMRFGAVDQCVKNCMITTEDGKHWYFINYDNDTVLGVRNDAQLVFNWDFDRDSYDYSGNSYAYAGAKSVLWNNLSMDDDFMAIVRSVDAAMYSGGLLSAKVVLQYLNEKQVGTWNERLYNAQEQIKYLSTFKNQFTTEKFLNFLQGTRTSHRNWWVNHRWELFDAMWNTGSYSDKRSNYYLTVGNASKDAPKDFLILTSASKFYFTVQKNNVTITDGFQELKAGESHVFYTDSNIGIGDPMTLIGTPKVKIINFRPGTNYVTGQYVLNAALQIVNNDGTTTNSNWVREDGVMMTKLLIGDGVTDCGLENIGDVNDLVSLEELDFRRCGQAGPSTFVITNLTNLRRFRAAYSSCTSFEPAAGITLNEVSLPYIPATVKGFELSLLNTLKLRNVTFEHQSVNDYKVYQNAAELGIDAQYCDTLPYTEDEEGNLGGIYTNETAFRYTNESKAIFDYQPTKELTEVEFINVKGFDTMKFVLDWKSVLLAHGQSPSACTLTLTNIDWEGFTVSELIEFVKGKDKNGNPKPTFKGIVDPSNGVVKITGRIKVVSDELDGNGNNKESITVEEYNKLIAEFGESVFNTGNALTITTGENIFYQPTGNSQYTETIGKYYQVNGVQNCKVYEVVRGDVFTAKANIFPKTDDEYRYVLSAWNYTMNGTTPINNGTINTITNNGNIYECAQAGIRLVTNADGTLTFTADDNILRENYNYLYALTVAKVDENGNLVHVHGAGSYSNQEPDTNIYIATINRVIPQESNVTTTIDGSTGNSMTVKDENEHTISFNLGANTNAPVTSVDYVLNDAAYADYVNIKVNEFTVENNILNIKFNANIPATQVDNLNIRFNIHFKTDKDISSISKQVNLILKPIYAKHINVFLGETAVLANNKFEINQTGIYRFDVKVTSDEADGAFNIPIVSKNVNVNAFIGAGIIRNYITISDIQTDENGDFFTVEIKHASGWDSFTFAEVINVVYEDKFTSAIPAFEFDLYESVVYPDVQDMYIGVQDYNNNVNEYVMSGSSLNEADIYLMNGQCTSGDGIHIISGQDHIKVKVLVPKTEVLDSKTNQLVEIEPTEPYTIAISNLSSSDTDKVTASIAEGTHGNDTIEVNIKAALNTIADVTVTGTYTLHYDVDRDETTANDITQNVEFTITVHYSVASASTYAKLGSGYYFVDADSNYYEIPTNNGIVSLTDGDMTTAIFNAVEKGITFVGFGYVVNSKPHFVYLRDTSDLFTVFAEAVMNGNVNTGEYINYLIPTATTMNMSQGSTTDGDSKYDTNSLFPGYYATTDWVNNYLVNTSGWSEAKLKTILGLFENNERVQIYVPTYKEITNTLGSTETFVNALDASIHYLISIGYQSVINAKLYTMVEFNDGIRTAFNGSDLSGASVSGTFTTPSDHLYFVTATPYISGNTLMCTAIIDLGDSDPSMSISPFNQIIASDIFGVSGYRNNIRILPFLKVS